MSRLVVGTFTTLDGVMQAPGGREICDFLATEISRHLPEAENKVWHAHPVWFLDGNPIVGYSKLKDFVTMLTPRAEGRRHVQNIVDAGPCAADCASGISANPSAQHRHHCGR